jgi:hypothetical protein
MAYTTVIIIRVIMLGLVYTMALEAGTEVVITADSMAAAADAEKTGDYCAAVRAKLFLSLVGPCFG